MSGLLCCVSETGPFKDEQLTLKRLPKATDDCAVVPCLFDDEDGRMQFARDFPWQLQGIMTQHDFEEIIDTINKAQPYRRAEACKKLLCLCGGCFFLCGKRGYVQEIRRANIRQFEKLGLSLLYRHDKIPAVEDAHEYYACGVPMHLAEWLEIRPNTFRKPAVPMGSVAKGTHRNPMDARGAAKEDGEASAGSGADVSSSSDESDARVLQDEAELLPGSVPGSVPGSAGTDSLVGDGDGEHHRSKRSKKSKQKKKKKKKRSRHASRAKEVDDDDDWAKLRNASRAASAAASAATSRAATPERGKRPSEPEPEPEESHDPEDKRRRAMELLGFSPAALEAAHDAKKEKEMGITPAYQRRRRKKQAGPSAAEIEEKQRQADERRLMERQQRLARAEMDKRLAAEQRELAQMSMAKRTQDAMVTRRVLEQERREYEAQRRAADKAQMQAAADVRRNRMAHAAHSITSRRQLKAAASLLALNITPGQQVHPLYAGRGAGAAAGSLGLVDEVETEYDADGVPLPADEPAPPPPPAAMPRSHTHHTSTMRSAARMAMAGRSMYGGAGMAEMAGHGGGYRAGHGAVPGGVHFPGGGGGDMGSMGTIAPGADTTMASLSAAAARLNKFRDPSGRY